MPQERETLLYVATRAHTAPPQCVPWRAAATLCVCCGPFAASLPLLCGWQCGWEGRQSALGRCRGLAAGGHGPSVIFGAHSRRGWDCGAQGKERVAAPTLPMPRRVSVAYAAPMQVSVVTQGCDAWGGCGLCRRCATLAAGCVCVRPSKFIFWLLVCDPPAAPPAFHPCCSSPPPPQTAAVVL